MRLHPRLQTVLRAAGSYGGVLVALVVLCALPRWVCGAEGGDSQPAAEKSAQKNRRARTESQYGRRTFRGTADSELKFGLLPPPSVAAGDKYPLVVCLHGAGGGTFASSVLARAEMREKYAAYVMVPEADRPSTWASTDVIRRRAGPGPFPEKLPVLIEAIRHLLKTEAIDPARVYITGQSMGGVGTWGALARHPELFAAAVPVCGAWSVDDAAKMVSVPVWAFHGDKDPTVPVHFSRDLVAAIAKAGGTGKYTEYTNVGHDSWSKAYEEPDLWKWLFAQRKAASGAPASPSP